jgi:hypothetical protein
MLSYAFQLVGAPDTLYATSMQGLISAQGYYSKDDLYLNTSAIDTESFYPILSYIDNQNKLNQGQSNQSEQMMMDKSTKSIIIYKSRCA